MKYDVVIIGSGPGGYVTALRSAQLGLKTALIEKMSTLGGTCLNIGCIPSKALLQSTELYSELLNDSKQHGIESGKIDLNFPQMMERKSKVVQGLVDGVAGLIKRNKIERIEGTAQFTSPHSIQVTKEGRQQEVEGSHFVLATGSESIALPFLPFDEKEVVSSTGALSLKEIPKRLAVIGGGVIGVEIASIYKRLGSAVTIIEMLDHICPTIDDAISKMLLQLLKKQGIEFHLSTQVVKADKGSEGISLTLSHDGKQQSLAADVVLVAVGRRPYTHGLGLEKIGVEINQRGFVQIDADFRTAQSHIFAIGDVIEGPMLAHRASEEGVAVAEIIAGERSKVNYLAIPNVIYTHPEVAIVGVTEKEARSAGLEPIVGTFPFRGNPRARAAGDTEGLVKVIADSKTHHLIGMHIIGADASELIGQGVLAIQLKAKVEDLAHMCQAHPTLSEAIKEAALDALGRVLHL